jgi:putative transcriptional regulator
MSKVYRSKILAAVHETMDDLHKAGFIDNTTMKRFDASCLSPVKPLTPNQIKKIRVRENASQTVFARYLNVTPGLISQWERGEKKPSGASLKLITLVAKNGLQFVA